MFQLDAIYLYVISGVSLNAIVTVGSMLIGMSRSKRRKHMRSMADRKSRRRQILRCAVADVIKYKNRACPNSCYDMAVGKCLD